MNNQFENFDDWDSDIEENTTINLPFQQSSRLGPRLHTTDTQIHQIGYHLGKHYPVSVINRNIHRNRIRVETNLDKAEEMMARGEFGISELLTERAKYYGNKLKHWLQIAENKRYEKNTGVTRINFPS